MSDYPLLFIERSRDEKSTNMKSSDKLLMTFVKSPELGKAKTRLAETIGKAKALEIYEALLSHTKSIIHDIPLDKMVIYAEQISHNDIWNEDVFKKDLQCEGDLGKRMETAFSNAFDQGYKKVVIIGSDCYDLNEKIILEAFNELDNNDVILGPAFDGGYYLLGMKKLHRELFDDMPWSTDKLLATTQEVMEDIELSNNLLTPLSDIDYEEDLKGDLLAIVKN